MNNTQIIKTLTASISEAIESMTPAKGRREYNPHTVKVRENLKATLEKVDMAEFLNKTLPPVPSTLLVLDDGKTVRHIN